MFGQLTIGDLTILAETATGWVKYADGGYPCRVCTYRGYYEELAINDGDGPMTALVFATMLDEVDGKTLRGYKGGDFLMTSRTPVWRAECGELGEAITGGIIDSDGNLILYHTADE